MILESELAIIIAMANWVIKEAVGMETTQKQVAFDKSATLEVSIRAFLAKSDPSVKK